MLKQLPLAVALLVASFLCSTTFAAQQLEPTFSQEQRIKLARAILQPTQKAASAAPQSDARKIAFTQHWAVIDPNWTAKFILKNPLGNKGVLWDNKAMLALTEVADEVDEATLLGLLEYHSESFVFYNYVERALTALPPENKGLRKKIGNLALKAKANELASLQFLNGRLKIALAMGDAKAIQQAQNNIDTYFESGAAEKTWAAIVKQLSRAKSHQKSMPEMQLANILRHSPKQFLGKFKVPKSSRHSVNLRTIIYGAALAGGDPTIAEDQSALKTKREQLNKIRSYPFGQLPHEYMRQAADLGNVAYIDPQIALTFAGGVPNGHAKCYAWLSIAPALSIEDPESARKLIVDCYEEIGNLPQGDRVTQNYNHPPAIIAAAGLPIVEFVAPELLPECLKATIAATTPMKGSNLADPEANLFEVIAAIARYDRQAAQKLYDENSGNLNLHSAPGFFRAMVALHPDKVHEEFQLIPETDERNINHQIQVRNAILPALLSKNDNDYWTSLFGSFYIKLDPRIVVRKERLEIESKK